MSHLSEKSCHFVVSIFEIKPSNNLASQGDCGKRHSLGVEKTVYMGSETAGGSPSEEQSSGDGFALHCVHKHLIHSVDTNYHLGDHPLISSYMSLYTQAEILQKCLMAMHYLIFNTCSSFPCRLVTFGLMAQAACSQSKAWLQGGQGAGVMKASSMETGKSADIVLPWHTE